MWTIHGFFTLEISDNCDKKRSTYVHTGLNITDFLLMHNIRF